MRSRIKAIVTALSNVVLAMSILGLAGSGVAPMDGGGATCTGTVATPTASHATGTYPSTITVSLYTSTSGASIYYTLDGTDPTSSATKKVYSGAFAVSATSTLKARAVKAGMCGSSEISRTYTICLVNDGVADNEPFDVTRSLNGATTRFYDAENAGGPQYRGIESHYSRNSNCQITSRWLSGDNEIFTFSFPSNAVNKGFCPWFDEGGHPLWVYAYALIQLPTNFAFTDVQLGSGLYLVGAGIGGGVGTSWIKACWDGTTGSTGGQRTLISWTASVPPYSNYWAKNHYMYVGVTVTDPFGTTYTAQGQDINIYVA
jgi:hypothetical protein